MSLAHQAWRILAIVLTLTPLIQYLHPTTLIDPTLPGWQNNAVVNLLLGLGFYIGLNGLESLYSHLAPATDWTVNQ